MASVALLFPDHEIEMELYRAWKKLCGDREGVELTPADYLHLQDETGVSLRAIWQLTRTWCDYAFA